MHPETTLVLDLRSEGLVDLTEWSDSLRANLARGITLAGKYAERELKEYFRGRPGNRYGSFAKSYDYKLRVRSGALRASIVSVSEGLQSRVGTALKYGAYNEFGARIPVTPKMRKFLGLRFGVWLRKSTKQIILPARPWFFPTIKKAQPGIIQTVRQAIDAPLKK